MLVREQAPFLTLGLPLDVASLLSRKEVPRSEVAGLVTSHLLEKEQKLAELQRNGQRKVYADKDLSEAYLRLKGHKNAVSMLGEACSPLPSSSTALLLVVLQPCPWGAEHVEHVEREACLPLLCQPGEPGRTEEESDRIRIWKAFMASNPTLEARICAVLCCQPEEVPQE